ncbi:DUF4111 domain-containing protein [Candidatus Woesebacteria bacterium]|nr:DUF4111 domain-containing protein [Candidatus Woesebacteria bacterium]
MQSNDVDQIIHKLAEDISRSLGNNLVGLYLFGSLTYGDFHEASSDIDLMAIVKEPVAPAEIQLLKKVHSQIAATYPKWATRIECSYTPVSMLTSVTPPKEPRPYYGENIFWPKAPYGNEWIINLYLVHTYGQSLIGPDFKTLVQSVDIKEVQKAAIKDLFKEWEPKLADIAWLNNSHYQSYFVLNLCRIFYTVTQADAKSKKVAADWVKKTYPEWSQLIETAQNWQYGMQMKEQERTIEFLKFVINQVKQSPLYSASAIMDEPQQQSVLA